MTSQSERRTAMTAHPKMLWAFALSSVASFMTTRLPRRHLGVHGLRVPPPKRRGGRSCQYLDEQGLPPPPIHCFAWSRFNKGGSMSDKKTWFITGAGRG